MAAEGYGAGQLESRAPGRLLGNMVLLFRSDDDDARVFGEVDAGIKGAHHAVFDDACDGQGTATLSGEMGFDGLRLGFRK